MLKLFLLLTTLNLMLFAYTDTDIDGVDDATDRCPNTPFYELVDSNGCSVSSTISHHKFDFIYGISFAQSDYIEDTTDIVSQTLQFDYYYKDFSLNLGTSYSISKSPSYNDNTLNDSYISASYQFVPTKNLKIKTGIGLILPTYDSELNNNNMDYTATLSASYALEDMNVFMGYNFTQMNDDDVVNTDITALYQNTNSYSAGLGFYPSQDTYLSTSYLLSDNIYVGGESVRTMSIYLYSTLKQNWFSTFNYAYGLSDSASDNYLSFKIGYNF